MKRYFALFASFALLLSACGSNELTEPTSRNSATYVGEIKSLGEIKVQDEITHLFETDDGEILYAYSERYDLDDEMYFGKRVESYGMISKYEELDKPLFEIKRITDAPLEEEAEEVTDVFYQDPDLGLSFTYPSDWTLETSIGSVTLKAPLGEEEILERVEASRDFIFIAQLEAELIETSTSTQEARAAEIRNFVSTHFEALAGVQGELAYVGEDRLFSVHYKTADSDSRYFIPRGVDLFEVSYQHETESDEDRLNHGNVFSSMVSGFRFTTPGEESQELEETEESEETKPKPEETVDPGESSAQITVKSYRELESKAFQFKMSYPGNWYYSGSSTGYDFDDEPVDDESTEAILTMQFNELKTEGVTRSGKVTKVTVEVDGRFYTISGPAEYEAIMQSMAKSIVSTKE